MGRPRAFDEAEVVRQAVDLFASRAYDGVSVDDLVTHLGVHRNSLYKTFGSKRGLYLAALRRHRDEVRPLLTEIAEAGDPERARHRALTADLGLFLLAAVERAPSDPEVATEVRFVLDALDAALEPHGLSTATVLGLHIRARIADE